MKNNIHGQTATQSQCASALFHKRLKQKTETLKTGTLQLTPGYDQNCAVENVIEKNIIMKNLKDTIYQMSKKMEC